MPSIDTPSRDRLDAASHPEAPGRRQWLRAGTALLGSACGLGLPAHPAQAQPPAGTLRLAAAWRGPRIDDRQEVGILEIPEEGPRLRIAARVAVPSRAHGLTALPDGGFVAVAFRPGHWMLRLDATGRQMAQGGLDPAGPLHFSGHAALDASGRWLLATACDTASGEGFISVHDASTLRQHALLRSGGIEPHQLVLDDKGQVLIAHGGLRRTRDGRRRLDLPVAASLDRLDLSGGQVTGRWTLDDPELSIRHLAYAVADGGGTRQGLALALQAEHADRQLRRGAPLLARWDGSTLTADPATQDLGGVAGDIAACPGGGHLVSQAQAGAAWRVGPEPETGVQEVARLREASALSTVDAPLDPRAFAGVWMAAAAGVARWHPALQPRIVQWPEPLAPDNHLAWLPDR